MAWKVEWHRGLRLPQIDWWLDAHFPVGRSFVSHAHFDHLAAHDEVLLSATTARLMRARLGGRRREVVLGFGEHWTDPSSGADFSLHPAGHIFGSAQCLIETGHGRLLYTGDFKLRPGASAEPCATPAADILIMETTYGLPGYVFPPTEEVLARLAAFCREALAEGAIPVLFGYSLGKSQEILRGLAGAGLPVMLHPQTFRMTEVYRELGIDFPPYRAFAAEEVAGHVVLCPPQVAGSAWLRRIQPRRTAAVTGWALAPGAVHRFQSDAAFPLSDHAGFDDLLRFVNQVRPRLVYTVHGFARQFAQTLRRGGLEAWALGEDNQLDLELPEAGLPQTRSAPAPAREGRPGRGTFETLAVAADAIAAAPGTGAKVSLAAEWLRGLDDEELPLGALFLSGATQSRTRERPLQVGWALVKRALLSVTGQSVADYREAYQRVGEAGEVAEAMLAACAGSDPVSPGASQADLGEIAGDFRRLAATGNPAERQAVLEDRLRRLTPRGAKYLVKLLLGDLRIGLREGLVEEALALATGRSLDVVREAHLLCGDLARVAAAARQGTLEQITLEPFHPLQFMLASPEPDGAAVTARLGPRVWVEDKFDGIRCQLHRVGARAELFSRDLRRITDSFPELAAAALALPADLVADGELLAWRGDRPLPFAELQRRLNRRVEADFFLGGERPVALLLYDLLWVGGEMLLRSPLLERRRRLEALGLGGAIRVAARSWAEGPAGVEEAFLAARARGHEGLVAKDPASPYTPGRRGFSWIKLKKAYATLDVVVTAVEYGHGKRRGVLSDYTFSVRDEESGALLPVGKAYSGLTDAEIAELTSHFLEHTVEVVGRVRRVVPKVVLEVAFDTVQASERHASGFALRFPRIARLRPDKGPTEIDTLGLVRRLAAAAAQASAG